jgi:hypothetical protein
MIEEAVAARVVSFCLDKRPKYIVPGYIEMKESLAKTLREKVEKVKLGVFKRKDLKIYVKFCSPICVRGIPRYCMLLPRCWMKE